MMFYFGILKNGKRTDFFDQTTYENIRQDLKNQLQYIVRVTKYNKLFM